MKRDNSPLSVRLTLLFIPATLRFERSFEKSDIQQLMAVLPAEGFSRDDRKIEFIRRTAARIFAAKGQHSTPLS